MSFASENPLQVLAAGSAFQVSSLRCTLEASALGCAFQVWASDLSDVEPPRRHFRVPLSSEDDTYKVMSTQCTGYLHSVVE